MRELPNTPLLVLAAAGMGLTGYLSLVAWFGAELPYCGLGSACDVVQSSQWARLLGLPTAFWGFLSYATLGLIAYGVQSADAHWRYSCLVAAGALGVSLYLTAISFFVIDATCGYCLVSLGLTAITLWVVWAQRPGLARRWPSLVQSGGIAVVAVVLLHIYYSQVLEPGVGPEDPYLKALAIHLGGSDVKFYGAFWCPHCKDQKVVFGRSAFRLPYVECTPRGRTAPPARVCSERGVRVYPTWVIAGERYLRVLEPDELARLTGFEWTDDAAPTPDG